MRIPAFLIWHLLEISKTTHENVTGARGTITRIAQALGHSGKFSTLKPHCLGGSLNVATLTHIRKLDTKGGTIK